MIAKLEDALEQSVRLRRTSPGSRGLHHSTEEHSETMGGASGGFSERLELTDFTDSTEITANIQLDPTNEQGVRMHLAKCHLSKGFFPLWRRAFLQRSLSSGAKSPARVTREC